MDKENKSEDINIRINSSLKAKFKKKCEANKTSMSKKLIEYIIIETK